MTTDQPIRVLIVDDEPMTNEYIQDELVQLGYGVAGAAFDGPEAVALTCELRPDLVLMDLQMPDPETGQEDRQAGLQATRAIQAQCPTPVVVLTAYETSALVEQATLAGVGAYLVKPVRSNDLDRAILIARARFNDLMALQDLNGELQAEITRRRQTEQELRTALREKEVLLAEIHHRVKNNLQVVSSFLDLQAFYALDERTREVLYDSRRRVQSMALIHEQLSHTPDLVEVDFVSYITTLVTDLFDAYRITSDQIRLKLDVRDVCLQAEQAVPCGLIINELVSNALKHAFPSTSSHFRTATTGENPSSSREREMAGQVSLPSAERAGGGPEMEECPTIHVGLYSEDDDRCVLTVSDNGIGLPADFEFPNTETLGLFLIETFALRLGGTIEWRSIAGTMCRIVFTLQPSGTAGNDIG